MVSLTGPRQSGKTTLVRAAFPDHAYVSLESPDHRAFAIEDPRGFLQQFSENAILDEVQRTPDLFSYIQGIVDEENRPGQFVLTGSHNFLLLHGIRQTLAGRCSVLHLLPLARTELTGRQPMTISAIGQPPSAADATDDWCEVLFKGSYPRIHDRGLDCQDWLRNYCETYLERNVRDMVNVGDLETFSRFLRLCAGAAASCSISRAWRPMPACRIPPLAAGSRFSKRVFWSLYCGRTTRTSTSGW